MTGQIQVTVGSTTYPFVIDPLSWSEVDIVDFAPRAVSGTPAWSEQGIYLDIGQESFNHGFGYWDFKEPQSYSFTGQGIDTRHRHISLFTTPTEYTSDIGLVVKYLVHRGIKVVATTGGVRIVRPSNGALSDIGFGGIIRDMLDTGTYVLVSNSSRLKVCDIAPVASATSNTLTVTSAGWGTDIFAGGVVSIVDGLGVGGSATIVSNTSTTITISGTWATTPNSTSYVIISANTGPTGNPPNNFGKMTVFGGYFWGYEEGTSYLHFWSEPSGSDAEGGGTTDTAMVAVGPVGVPIVNLTPFNNQLWVFRQDGAWTVNEDNLAYHTLDFASEKSTLNFATVIVWNGFMIFPVRNTLYKYKSGLQDITPPVWNENPPYKQFGNFRGLVARGKYLYVMAQSNAANTTEESQQTTGFVSILATNGVGWHKLIDISITSITGYNMWLDPEADRLTYTVYNGVAGYNTLRYVQLQTLTDLPYDNYPTTGTQNFYSSYFDLGMPRVPKSFASLTLGGAFPTGTSVIAYYRTDATTSWTSIGTFTSDMQEVDFATGVTGKKIQFKLTLATTSAASTPIVKRLIMKCMIRPDVLYGVTCEVMVSDNLADHQFKMLGLTADDIRTALKSARSSVPPITLVDIYGVSGTAYLSSLRFFVVAYEDTEDVQAVARCTFTYV